METSPRSDAGSPLRPDRSAPLAGTERHELIDVVRGFALFGVLLSNMVGTAVGFALPDEQRAAMPMGPIDGAAAFVVSMLIEDKFYTLFSTLFGLGFAVQLSRASARGVDIVSLYTRRLIVLFVIGAAHATLVWSGDVLHTYALLGFALLLCRRCEDRTVLRGAIAIAVLVSLFPVLHYAVYTAQWQYPTLFGRELDDAEKFEALAHGGYGDVVELHCAAHLHTYGRISFRGGFLGWYLSILWKFLFGFYIGRRMLLGRAVPGLTTLRRALPWALAVGIAGNAYAATSDVLDVRPQSLPVRVVLRSLYEASTFCLSASYVAMLVLLFQRPRWQRAIKTLAPVGRMALTNYLTHSLFFVGLFYGIGLGLLGEVGEAVCVVLSIALFGGQIAASGWWLRRFRFGPIEWLWRSLTYRRWQPMSTA